MENTPKGNTAISSDLIASLTASLPSIPGAIASGILAGINPISGLHGLGADPTHYMELVVCKTSLQISNTKNSRN
jgi:MFS superfamily sulfate permease-like transporter